ncbi:hypothetical protein [Arthrobacter zhaoguopingii]|uniref:hypothetical protein n=1 Tax=Arthrobacter zhaoguopingii TaxID=2681491 RepID=UPI001356C1F5|nr:hypothetical protein [Arthrobacter zhaoguopingii]
MGFYRVCVWVPEETHPGTNGHPLFVWPYQGGSRVDDPAGEYLVLYMGDTAARAVVQNFGNYPRWTPDALVPPPGEPAKARLVLTLRGRS